MVDIQLDLSKFKKPEPKHTTFYYNSKAQAHKAFKRWKNGMTLTKDDIAMLHLFYPSIGYVKYSESV